MHGQPPQAASWTRCARSISSAVWSVSALLDVGRLSRHAVHSASVTAAPEGVAVWHPVALSSNAAANSVSLGTVGLLEITDCIGAALPAGPEQQAAEQDERGAGGGQPSPDAGRRQPCEGAHLAQPSRRAAI